MSDSPRKQAPSSPPMSSEPAAPERRRRGRVLLAASATGVALAVIGCQPLYTTNPAACVYDGGFYDDDCDPSNGTNGNPQGNSDAGPDAGADAGEIIIP